MRTLMFIRARMTTRNSERERALVTTVARWFRRSARPLPWRDPSTTPWGVLLSEIMAQQTPVARVVPIWLEWIERWPTPAALANASPADAARAAKDAGVKALVLYHLVPPLPSRLIEPLFLGDAPKVFDGPLKVGHDGMIVSLPAGGKDVRFTNAF